MFRTNPLIKGLALCAAGLFAMQSQAVEPSDFDCSFLLSDGAQSIRSVTLNNDVYRCFQYERYTDLAIINADKQLVPFTIDSPAVSVEKQKYTKDIAFFQEPAAASYRTGDQIRRIAALTGVVSARANDLQWQNTNIHYSSIILQQPEQLEGQRGDQLTMVSLSVNSGDKPINATVVVEASDDLQNWRTLSKPHNLYFLPGKDKNLNSSSLALTSRAKAKYFRLATLSNVRDFTSLISSIKGEYLHTQRTTQPMQWFTVEPVKVAAEKGTWQFELPGLVEISELRFSNAENIVYYQGTVMAEQHVNPVSGDRPKRNTGKKKVKAILKKAVTGNSRQSRYDGWRTVSSFNQYRLIAQDGSIESPGLEFWKVKSRVWKIRFKVPSELTAEQLPKVEFGWRASQVNFIAQGNGPFSLLVGNSEETKKIAYPSQLRSLGKSAEKVELFDSKEPANQPQAVLDNRENTLDSRWGEIALWVLLVLGVGLMLRMAYQLTRKMNVDP